MNSRPHYTYFQACVGRWRCPLKVQLIDSRQVRSAMGLGNLLALRVLSWWPSWLGLFYLETTVVCQSTQEVLHTTAVRWMGVPLLRTAERLVLDENGHDFLLRGEGRSLATPWIRSVIEGTGHVDASATRASYNVNWMGLSLEQTTVLKGEQVLVVQKGSGFYAEQPLCRVGSPGLAASTAD